ncbi:MAG: disulfide bond formation protein B [Roseivivax sp.]|nr:disulfide bond formation protein B [Roseivivax sp.]
MSRRSLYILLAAGGSAALLLGALGFQYLGGLAPCKLCIWQRWPHLAAVLIALPALATRGPVFPWLGALAAAATAAVGGYHTGVERSWWEGPTTCTTSNDIGAMSTDALLESIMNAPLVRCDEVPWEMFSLSMASWNMILSLALVALWLMAARAAR